MANPKASTPAPNAVARVLSGKASKRSPYEVACGVMRGSVLIGNMRPVFTALHTGYLLCITVWLKIDACVYILIVFTFQEGRNDLCPYFPVR